MDDLGHPKFNFFTEVEMNDAEMSVMVIDKNPLTSDADGNLALDPSAVEWQSIKVKQMSGCDHAETMCLYCIDQWGTDYYLRTIEGEPLNFQPPPG